MCGHRWEVQSIVITSTGPAVSGHFQLLWNGQPASRQLRYDEFDEFIEVWAAQLAATLL
jgi:hypothetical protein